MGKDKKSGLQYHRSFTRHARQGFLETAASFIGVLISGFLQQTWKYQKLEENLDAILAFLSGNPSHGFCPQKGGDSSTRETSRKSLFS